MTYEDYKEFGQERNRLRQVPVIVPEKTYTTSYSPQAKIVTFTLSQSLQVKGEKKMAQVPKVGEAEWSDGSESSAPRWLKTQAMARRMAAIGGGIGGGGLLSGFLDQFPEGFFVNLFTAWLTSMFGCELPIDGASARAICQRNYRGDGRYRRRFFARAARGVRQEAARLGDSLTRQQSHAVTQIGLDDIRTGDDQEMSQVIFEQRSLAV